MNGETGSGQRSPAGRDLTIQIGSINCKLIFSNSEDYGTFRRIYADFLTEDPPDITIGLETTNRLSEDNLEEVLSRTIYSHNGGHFWTTSQIVSGQYDLASRVINITAEKSLGDISLEYNHLNRLITLAYYSGCKIKYNGNLPAMLLHASGILRHGKAILFAGPSEIGKTTVASLCGDWFGDVINDEMVLITRPGSNGTAISIRGVPVIGGTPWRRNVAAPLSHIFLLKQGNETRVNPLEKSRVYLGLIRQVVNPAYIGQKNGRDVYSLMADFSSELVANIPVDELEFTLDKGALCRTLESLEESEFKLGENGPKKYSSCR